MDLGGIIKGRVRFPYLTLGNSDSQNKVTSLK